jgi:hypothetical protein
VSICERLDSIFLLKELRDKALETFTLTSGDWPRAGFQDPVSPKARQQTKDILLKVNIAVCFKFQYSIRFLILSMPYLNGH